MEVGVRELRDHLSRYLEGVRTGTEVVVTEHGKAIARLVPVHGERALDRLIAEGLVTPAKRRRARPRPVEGAGTASDLVANQRR